MCSDMSVEVLVVGETLAGQMSPKMMTGPNPLLVTSAWSSKTLLNFPPLFIFFNFFFFLVKERYNIFIFYFLVSFSLEATQG